MANKDKVETDITAQQVKDQLQELVAAKIAGGMTGRAADKYQKKELKKIEDIKGNPQELLKEYEALQHEMEVTGQAAKEDVVRDGAKQSAGRVVEKIIAARNDPNADGDWLDREMDKLDGLHGRDLAKAARELEQLAKNEKGLLTKFLEKPQPETKTLARMDNQAAPVVAAKPGVKPAPTASK
jgi:hypothetical protein